eukprot:CAMPEP_0172553694 /NCGR_PEP_ID=MMETSP1067-20121228/51352_1 /TAXON_ID=265564 ORGANISM="Thalassiosira punctigera, Strain Tpunct2005C2" /NCGR_SAMPLE_ID=MMETSP1067 /ASSEMBLY_ACC=CAM_ASM_000444 /LENGTH=296 /DNA_ID=CAMNT_0013341913 /DNA_START=96 /DNA_END=986 /DNA_ORIENTATION=-
MKSSKRQAKKAAKARLSGAISSSLPKNKKIVFGDDDDDANAVNDKVQLQQNNDSEDKECDEGNVNAGGSEEENGESESVEDEDAVEEVKGSAARESTQRIRESERKVKHSLAKNKRKKKAYATQAVDAEVSEDENNENEDLLTDDFFKLVDAERADQLQKAKQRKKTKEAQEKKRLGKHTTFVVEDEHKMTDAPHRTDQNIEVVAIGGGGSNNGTTDDVDYSQQLLTSVTLGSAPSNAAIAFARGSMTCGTSKDRSSDSRKRKSKNEETWKRSRKFNKLGVGSRPGQAAALFVRKR